MIALLASGPSLCASDVNRLKGRCDVMAISDVWRLVPWARYLYSCDQRWWQHHDYAKSFRGERWTQEQPHRTWPQEARRHGINVIRSVNKPGLSTTPGLVHTGNNSGFQALNLAVLMGYRTILLLGYDLCAHSGKTHFFGDHPPGLQRNSPYALFRRSFESASSQLDELGVRVVNCSRVTTLRCFEMGDLDEELSYGSA